ncbi:hypothetical protein [Streptomyces sp. NPDC055607]
MSRAYDAAKEPATAGSLARAEQAGRDAEAARQAADAIRAQRAAASRKGR